MIPVMHELTATCAVCGEVACERDLVYAEDGDFDGVDGGDVVCADCAAGRAAEGDAR